MAKRNIEINVEFLNYFKDGIPHGSLEIATLSGLRYAAVMRRIYRLEASKCITRVSEAKRRPTIYTITDFGKVVLSNYE